MEKITVSKINMGDDSVITASNIIRMGEIFALCSLKYRITRTGINFHRLYQGLIHDIYRKKDNLDPYTDGYDIANTAIVFLCQHIGKHLGDIIPDRYGKPATVRQCCFRYVDSYVFRQYVAPSELSISLDETIKVPTSDLENYISSEDDYNVVDRKISEMNLTQSENNVLECYMSGLGHVETAKTLNVNRTTVWRCRQRLIQKYNKTFR